MNNHSYSLSGTYASRVQGSTLIEVVVAMFVLAFGLLALVAMQTRTHGSVREAEYTTRVAQLTSNLVEGMLANPDLATNTGGGVALRQYSRYGNPANQPTSGCNTSASLNGNATVSQDDLARAQLCDLKTGLDRLPGAQASFAVCSGVNAAAADRPTTLAPSCNIAAGTDTVVRVVWAYQTNAADASGLQTGGTGDHIYYSYQARVTEN